MGSILFGNNIDMLTVATPSSGFLVAYDLDGILKQKDELGVITEIGGGLTAGSGVPSLSSVLSVGNLSGTGSIIMGTSTVISSSNGGGQINLDYNTNEVFISTDNGAYSTGQQLHLSPGYIELSDYSTGGYIGIYTNESGNDTSDDFVGHYVVPNSGFRVGFEADKNKVSFGYARYGNDSYNIIAGYTFSTFTSSNSGNIGSTIISSRNSSIMSGLYNTVVLGGSDISANLSNTIYAPNLNIKNDGSIKGIDGSAELSFTEYNSFLATNSDSLIAIISSSESNTITTNGVIVSDTATSSYSPNIDSAISFISTKSSYVDYGVINSVIIGGQTLNATQSDTVYLGNNVNINNAYTLPNTDGSNGQSLITNGAGIVTWGSAISNNFSNTNLTFTGNREHNTDGYYYQLTTDGPAYAESWHYLDSTINQLGFNLNQIYFDNSTIVIRHQNNYRLTINSSETIFNNDALDYDFIVKGDTDESLLFIDASTDRIGIGTSSLSYKLQVSGTISTTGFRMTNGASSGYLLQSDASGNATWISATSISTNFANTNLTFTGNRVHNINGYNLDINTDNSVYNQSWFYVTKTDIWLAWKNNYLKVDTNGLHFFTGAGTERLRLTTGESIFNYSGSNSSFRFRSDNDENLLYVGGTGTYQDKIGVGTASPSYKLHVVGTVSTTGFRMTNGASSGYLLQSDASGNATWQSSTSIGLASKYSTTNSFTASVTQTITHNLGTDDIIVQCYDSSGVMIIPGTVQINGLNDVDITFSSTLSSVKTIIIG